eukprot:g2877.t1
MALSLLMTIIFIILISIMLGIAAYIVQLPLMYLDEGEKALAFIKKKQKERRQEKRKKRKKEGKQTAEFL